MHFAWGCYYKLHTGAVHWVLAASALLRSYIFLLLVVMYDTLDTSVNKVACMCTVGTLVHVCSEGHIPFSYSLKRNFNWFYVDRYIFYSILFIGIEYIWYLPNIFLK